MAHPNEAIAREWVDAFNAHDVRRLVSLYAADAKHASPKLAQGFVQGHAALTEWWEGALRRTPTLRYALTTVTANDARVFIEYERLADCEKTLKVAEVFDVAGGKISGSRVYHG